MNLTKYEVIIFYRLREMPDLVFHEIIPIQCGNRVNAKKYAAKDFEDLVNDSGFNLNQKVLGLDMRIKSKLTTEKEIMEHEDELARIEYKEDQDKLNALFNVIGKQSSTKKEIIKKEFNKRGIDTYSKLLYKVNLEDLYKSLEKLKGISYGTTNLINNFINDRIRYV